MNKKVTPDPKRLELDKILNTFVNHVYFNPTKNIQMKYDCIRYRRAGFDIKYADDKIYSSVKEYELIAIYTDPDSDLPDKLLNAFQMIRHERHYISENLIHDVFRLYY